MSAPLFEQSNPTVKTAREWLQGAGNINELCNIMNWVHTVYLDLPWKKDLPRPNVWQAIGMAPSDLPRWGDCPVENPGNDIFSWGPYLHRPWLLVVGHTRQWEITRISDYIARKQWLEAARKRKGKQ